VTQAAVDWIVGGNRDGYAFCRVDRDPATDERLRMEVHGTDMFAVDWRWWTRERRRFRPYIAGELRWDNVYTAVMCTHGRGDIVDRRDLIFHQQHPVRWDDRSPYARYNGYLGALDARYFSRWVQYVYTAQNAPPSSDAEHDRLIEQTFALRPLSAIDRAIDVARYVRATVKYRWQKLTSASRSD
jgi:hypothetical protein